MFFESKYDRNEFLFCAGVTLVWVFAAAMALLS